MKHDAQIVTIRRLLKQREIDRDEASIGEPVQVPVRSYMAPEVLGQEMATVFRNHPLVAGHASAVREPGSTMLSPWDKLPYVVVRDQEGTLRAFLNICKHRGAPLVSGTEQKSLKALVCPYHGWTYRLDGSLLAVTKPETFPGIDCKKNGLTELPVAEHMGLIWVHPTPGAKLNVPAFLGPEISSDLEHFGLDKVLVHRRQTVTKNANWKLLLMTYLDRYHVPTLHRNSIAPYFQKGVIVHYEHDAHIRIAAGLTDLPKAASADPDSWRILNHASVLYSLFPNTYIIFHTNLVSINRFYPEAPDRTTWIHDMFYREDDYQGEEGQAALAARYANIDGVFSHEDFGIAERCQAGLPYGREYHHLGLEEGLLALFQRSVEKAMG